MSQRYLTAARQRQLEAKLTQPDLAVLQRVSDLRFVSGLQLTRLCFSGSVDPAADARAARRALLRLTRLGALDRLPRQVGGVRSGSAGYVYRLGLLGQHLAIRYGWQPERRTRRSLVPGTLFLSHALQVAELHTRLVEADRSGSFELLELSAEPACWRSFGGLGPQRQRLKPDSYVRLGLEDFEDSYFIEVDRGTEGSQTIARQLTSYVAYFDSEQEQAEHGVFPRVLWLAPDERRVGIIEAEVGRLAAAHGELFQVTVFDRCLDVMVPTIATRSTGARHDG
jgi:Replication-relaxation